MRPVLEPLGQLGEMGDSAPWPTSPHGVPAVHPDEAHSGGARGGAVHGRVVADVHRLLRSDRQRVERHVEDARVGLGVAAALRGDDRLEEGDEAGRGKARALHAVDAVGHDPEAEAGRERLQHRPAAGQAVAARRETVEIDRAEAGGLPRVGSDLSQQAAEALLRECLLRDGAAPVGGPELVVDAPVGGERRRRTGNAEGTRGPAQGGALGLVEVEEGPVEVEEDGEEAGQGPTWRGR